jgi:methylated-DNA-[protein]-cysteine S-methyltransferase
VDDFRDVLIDPGPQTEFQRLVVDHCRQIPPGATLTYGELAARAGRPRSARAIGNCMAANRIPLIVPCHRVVGADGGLRGYSANGGLRLKQRLLDLESLSVFHGTNVGALQE